jgi:hypothetical protein
MITDPSAHIVQCSRIVEKENVYGIKLSIRSYQLATLRFANSGA